MRLSDKGLIALARKEGVVLVGYKDSVGVWTIGVGHTAAAGPPIPKAGLKITLTQAIALFQKDVILYESAVLRAIKVPLAQHEFDALVSFHYNTGGIARAQLTKALNRGDREGAARGFMGWTNPPSILGRRKEEQHLFRTGEYGSLNKVPVWTRYPGQPKLVSTAEIFGGKV